MTGDAAVMRLLALSAVLVVACHATPRPAGAVEPLRMGNAHHVIDTRSPEIQREFDAGLDALYAFNFDEAGFWFVR
jgi:hypothetical protein